MGTDGYHILCRSRLLKVVQVGVLLCVTQKPVFCGLHYQPILADRLAHFLHL